MSFTVRNHTHSPHVTTTSDHSHNTSIESDEISDFACRSVDLDGVVDLDHWIRISDSISPSVFFSECFQPNIGPTSELMTANLRASIVRDQEWDCAPSNLYSSDFSKFVFSLSLLDAVHGEATLNIIDEAEVLAGLLDGDHVHEACGVCAICAHFSIDFDETLHEDLYDFAAVKRVLQSVAEEDDEGEAVSSFL